MSQTTTLIIKPMPPRMSLLFFGLPAVFTALVVHVVMPFFAEQGLSIFYNYLLVYATVPMLLLITASLVAFRLEGNEMSWATFKTRFRLTSMGGKAWLWAIGLTLFMFLSAGWLSFTARRIASFPALAPPDYWPAELKPAATDAPTSNAIPTEFLGMPLAGNWWIAAAFLASLIIATLGEELWWRGYILPRQELVHGKWTWVVHGILWTLFHWFAPWNLFVILPGCLTLSFVAQRLKNTWPGIFAHALANGILVMGVVVIGIVGR